MKSGQAFPFDCIIVTSPDEASAKSANGPLEILVKKRLRRKYPSQTIRVISTCDPFGARCGSGGGTLAALEFASPGDSVLILHAGGDSSRCPTQMILGKAWTSMPDSEYRNPTIWLIDQIEKLYAFAKFPKGTLVVAATDVLLKFFDEDRSISEWNYQYSNKSESVLGVAVPAGLSTAKNHGVYILHEFSGHESKASLAIQDPVDVLQKPSIERLDSTTDPAPASFRLPMHREKQAWIDTGLVIFLPEAVGVLYSLVEGPLRRCTRKGLTSLYEREGTHEQSLEDFGKTHALKIDLYTDILHNLSFPGQRKEGTQQTPLQQALSRLPLKVLVVSDGTFLHLGTSAELLDFFTSGVYSNTFPILKPRYQCWKDPRLAKNVALFSIFAENSKIGNSTLVEYSDLSSYARVSIGDNCILSGWRNPSKDTTPLVIPDNLCVQVLSLVEIGYHVFMVLGIRDAIKTKLEDTTIFGLSLKDFIYKTNVTLDQLGLKEDDTIWTAKLHPKVSPDTSFESVYGWIEELAKDKTSISENASLANWLALPRVSLRDIHSLANAGSEWKYRRDLELEIIEIQRKSCILDLQTLLLHRCHDKPCNFQWLWELEDTKVAETELSRIVTALENIAQDELKKERYDICGRAFMIASAILADFNAFVHHQTYLSDKDEISEFCLTQIRILRSSSTKTISKEKRLDSVDKIIEYRRNDMENGNSSLGRYSQIMERLAFSMNELSIADGFYRSLEFLQDEKELTKRGSLKTLNRWVLSTAGARIDLAGGWSDTPPLCYEFGGSVTGMAVLVDNHMPLSCRCRIVTGKRGILLRSEIRDGPGGSLSSCLQSELFEISHLSDFRDPLADCALVKSALVCLGLASEQDIQSGVNLQYLINSFCSATNDVRLEVVTTSLLPQGSGMGTSSILGACTLSAIARCVGIREFENESLVHAVLMLEQLLSSGGGWQDQVHGIIPGIKTVRSDAAKLPLNVSVEKINVDTMILKNLEKRLILAFTGKTRLAKNILQNVLRRWARRTQEIVDTVERLVATSENARSALLQGNLDLLGQSLLEYSRLKVVMAGADSNVEPREVKFLVTELTARNIIQGHALCGAGGGGFLVMLATEGNNTSSVSDLVQKELSKGNEALKYFTWHNCRISDRGLTTTIIEEDNVDVESFNLDWQYVEP